ncbi:dTMP kinase [Pseudomonas nitritireducens]|uniref:Thymidylate kinase n=1 Tax=Pseudomonas nitroreducens TaxID=46680 RepID=A0A7W7KED5_PSENT|nr:dTMP kinase [Pseudomonas nitritireducens]MBB4861302.1 dTMP kinase [Pseudomonas nitritireducens]
MGMIAIEGIEACGKSTQIKRLLEHYSASGREVLLTSDLYHTVPGITARELLLNEELEISPKTQTLLMTMARMHHVEERILPALAEGKLVISDRFWPSTLAYNGPYTGWPVELLQNACVETLGVTPDLVIFIDIPAELSKERSQNRGSLDKFERRGVDFYRGVRASYQELAKKHGFVTIDGTASVDEVFAQLVAAIDPVIGCV